MEIQENIPLAPLTTLKVGGPARYFAEVRSEAEAVDAVGYAGERRLPLFVLGGGSNIVVADEGWPGLILKIAILGINREADSGDMAFHAGAGENWDAFVAGAVKQNCGGIECLSGIPGTVGGTPLQNVGAYGQEVAETISRVRALEITSGKIVEFNNAGCGFSYRSSIFNTTQKGRYLVLQTTYRLRRNAAPRIEYADLKKFFSSVSARPTLQQAREAVRSIRLSKAMLIVEGDEDCRSVGSFFRNPLVSPAEAQRVAALAQQRAPQLVFPQYPGEQGQVKLSAAWLVEQAGIHKGYARGPAGISHRHTLAIVNRGGATARDIMAVKNEVHQRVFDVWGISLEPEPVFVGFDHG